MSKLEDLLIPPDYDTQQVSYSFLNVICSVAQFGGIVGSKINPKQDYLILLTVVKQCVKLYFSKDFPSVSFFCAFSMLELHVFFFFFYARRGA